MVPADVPIVILFFMVNSKIDKFAKFIYFYSHSLLEVAICSQDVWTKIMIRWELSNQ